jgi:hypothetical protein
MILDRLAHWKHEKEIDHAETERARREAKITLHLLADHVLQLRETTVELKRALMAEGESFE